MPVELRNAQRRVGLDLRRFRRDAQRLLDAVGEQRQLLSILLTDDRQMAWLHQRWMGIEGATDVMSFPMGGPQVLGDIVISAETAVRRRPADPQAEAVRCLIHGLLHLLGYDHRTSAQRLRMSRRARWLSGRVAGR